jgi:hypothetical protein
MAKKPQKDTETKKPENSRSIPALHLPMKNNPFGWDIISISK